MDDIDRYLTEDIGEEGDITSDSLFTDESAEGKIVVKEDCIVAGLKEAEVIFNKFNVDVNLKFEDGDSVKKGSIVAIIRGPARSILKVERLILNIIGRMSGIATETRKLVEICKQQNTKATIAATRKTTPGFRKFEKKAVEIGGGESHRFGLFDAVMIKDNHLKLIGSLEEAIKITKKKVKSKIIEVEVENEEDAITAARLYVDVIMLDNFDPKSAEAVTHKIKEINPNILVEISGGITIDNIIDYATFADRISLGYITNSIKCIDFSLELI